MNEKPSLLKIYLSFLKISAFAFGGGLAMMPLLHEELVVRTAWLSEDEL